MTEQPAPEDGASGPAAERQSTPFLVLQFFIFPMAIVAVCVAVFVVFGLIASEGHGARDYLAEVRTGSANRRWQAAFELSKLLQAGKDPGLRDPKFVGELVRLYEDAGNDDPRVRRYLALAMGRLGDPLAVPALARTLRDAGPEDDSEASIYAVWALGAIGDPSALPVLLEQAGVPDAGIRKTAVHALGAQRGEAARAALRRALEDPAEDVRWNAALALARRGDPACVPVLRDMLDRSHLAGLPGLSPEQQETAIVEAATSAGSLGDEGLLGALETLRRSDPSLKVREAAREALARRPGAPSQP